jgi:hypothetical protein
VIDVVVPCSCPGTPHEQDTVWLSPVVDVRIGAAATTALRGTPWTISDVEGALAGAFLHFAPRDWTFVDDKGDPLPVTIENIDARLTWSQGGMEVAEKADELYAGAIVDPLVQRMSKALNSTRTTSSTSQIPSPGSDTDSSDKPSLRAVSGGKRSGAKAS